MSLATTIPIRIPATCPHKHTAYCLANGANVIVVEDKACTTPAAAMSVAVGTNNDPTEFPGLAHFCEHMLFMGTAKYPSEDAYSTAVNKSGGHSNAWTDLDTTTFYFTSGIASYKEVLEMFLDFFVAPSFNTSAVDREINAVHSEDEKNHSIDFWRLDELYRGLFSQEHPRHYYGNGNITTLKHEPEAKGMSVHEALKAFFAKYYVAQSCALVLYSPMPAEELIASVAPILGLIKSGEPAPRSFLPKEVGTPLRPETMQKWYNVLTTSKERTLRTSWVVPNGFASWRTKPTSYITHILGHEVKGSIISVLRSKGWATDLTSSCQRAIDDNFREVTVIATLTKEGAKNQLAVIGLIFDCIEMMRRIKRVPEDQYKEIKQSCLTHYELSNTGSAENYAASMSTNTIRHGLAHASDGPVLIHEDDTEETMRLLDCLTVEKCVVTSSAGDPEAFLRDREETNGAAFVGNPTLDQKTRFHGMPYSVCEIPAEKVAAWSRESMATATLEPALSMPSPNPFFSEDFSIHQPPADTNVPARVEMKYGYALVKRNESHLMKPLMAVTINLLFDQNEDADAFFFRKVMIDMIDVSTVDTTYLAELAAMHFSISNGTAGFIVSADGPSAALPAFVVDTLAKLLNKEFMKQTPELFHLYKEKAISRLKGAAEAQPCSLANTEISAFYRRYPSPLWHQQLAFATDAEKCNYERFSAFVEASLAAIRTEIVVDGNLPQDMEAAAKSVIIDPIDKVLESTGAKPATIEDFPPFRDFYSPNKIGNGELYIHRLRPFSKTNVNAAMVAHLYVGPASPEHWAVVQTLSNLMESHFFAALRTREALGYIVQSYRTKVSEREATIVFAAQSAVAPPMYLYSRFHAFIDAFGEQFMMGKLTQKDVDTAVAGVISSLKAPVTSVKADANRVFGDRLNPFGWHAREQQIEFLERAGSVTVEVLQNFYKKFIANNAEERRGFVVLIDSEKLPENESDAFPDAYAEAIKLPAKVSSEAAASSPVATSNAAAEEEEEEGEDEEDDGAGEGEVEVKLDMNTFTSPTYVKFTPILDAADAVSKSTLISVPLL